MTGILLGHWIPRPKFCAPEVAISARNRQPLVVVHRSLDFRRVEQDDSSHFVVGNYPPRAPISKRARFYAEFLSDRWLRK